LDTITSLKADIAIELRKLDQMKAKVEAEKRSRTKDEIAEANTILDKVEELEAAIAAEEREQAYRGKTTGKTPETPAENGEQRVLKTDNKFESFGHFLKAVIRAEDRNGDADPRLKEMRLDVNASGMNESNPSDGGYFVGKDVSTELIKETIETALLWSKVRHVPISAGKNGLKMFGIDQTSRADGSRYGGVRAYWADEAGTVTATAPKFRVMELSLKKLMAFCYLTDELMSDAVALEAVVRDAFRSEMGFKFDDSVMNGSGAGKPLGVLNAGCLVSITAETGQASTSLLAENIEKMYARNNSKTKAEWYINTDIWPQMFKFAHVIGASGVPLFVPPGGISSAPLGTLLGRPLVELEQCATLGTVGDIIFADLSKYVVIDKGGMNQASSVHVRFLYDENVLRFTWRLDGQPVYNSALTPYKGSSNTVSPFTVIASR
jgi:HK97 family phage major capsid protein